MTIATFPLPPRDALGNPQPLPGRFVTTLPVTPGATVVIGAPTGSGEITVLSPQGQPIASGSGSVTVSPTTSRVVLTVDAPQPGYVTAVQVASGGTLLPDPSASGLVLGSTGVEQGDWDWTAPANLGAPGAVGEVLTATGTAEGDYDWAALPPQVPTPGAVGEVLTATGTAEGDYDWAALPPQVPTPASVGQVLVSDGSAAGDLEWITAGGGVLASNYYDPSSSVSYSLATTLTALDTTHLALTFTVPPSGNVLIRLAGVVDMTESYDITFGVVDSAGSALGVAGVVATGTTYTLCTFSTPITGLTPGVSETVYFAAMTADANYGQVLAGSNYGPAVISAEALP